MRPQINLFNNPTAIEIEKRDSTLLLELNELQSDSLLSTKEIDISFWKKLAVVIFNVIHFYDSLH